MRWLELTLRLPAESFPQAEALLQLAGAVSVSISDDSDTPILEPEPGTTPLWPALTARAHFSDDVNAEAVVSLLGPIPNCDVSAAVIDDDELSAGRPEPILPVEIGPRLTIVPAESYDRSDERMLGLNMGLAFGTGQHPTTQLCLRWLESEMPAGISVLDYGSGSGVLALAALKLGAETVTAVDNDPQALAATKRNAELNGVRDSIRIGPPEILGSEPFDLIVANILARPLIDLADQFAERQSPGGQIVLSGILISQLDELEASYRTSYDSIKRSELADWGLLTGTRRKGYDR